MENLEIVRQLQNALALIMNPLSNQKLRAEAHQFCEEFKASAPNCAKVGIELSRKENDQITRHFGFQLIEYCVRFRWNSMSLDEKKFIKESSMELIKGGTLDIVSEQRHIKDGLSRIIVEIAKREWPQQWLSMISEFDAICTLGPTQTELILLVFLRLAEDVLMFQTTPQQRRRDIQQAFVSIMPQLLSFLHLTLNDSYRSIVATSISNLTATQSAVSVQGKLEERIPLVEAMISEKWLEKLKGVAIVAASGATEERTFRFFKKLCQVLVTVGTQMSSVLDDFFPEIGGCRYRSDLSEVIRQCACISPDCAFKFAAERLETLLNKTVLCEDFDAGMQQQLPQQLPQQLLSPQPDHSLLHQLYLEWESIIICLENVVEKVDFDTFDERLVQSAIRLYSCVLDFRCPDATVTSYALSVVSSLLPLVVKENSLLTRVMEKPGFDLFYSHIKQMSAGEMSQMEKCTCYEALIIIHNMKRNFGEQVMFLKEIAHPVVEYWLSESFTSTVWSAPNLMDFIGITREPVEPSSDDVSGINRSQMQYCLTFILSVIKRSEFIVGDDNDQPAVPSVAVGGDYSSGGGGGDSGGKSSSSGSSSVDPSSPLFKSYHEMFNQSNFSKVYPDFVTSFKMSEGEKTTMTGVPMSSKSATTTTPSHNHSNNHNNFHNNTTSTSPYNVCSADPASYSKDPIERMLTFFNNLSDLCYNIIGNSFKHVGYSFYMLPDLSSMIVTNVLNNIFLLPEHRIKQILYFILKPLVLNCPKECHEKVIVPIVKVLCPSFYQYLTTKWQLLTSRNAEDLERKEERSEYQEREELVEEQMIKLITREYLDFIDCLFKDKKLRSLSGQQQQQLQQPQSDNSHSNNNNEEMMDDGDAGMAMTTTMMMMNQRKNKEEVFGDVGEIIMADEEVSGPIVFTLFVSLSWQDSSSCMKSVIWCYPVLKKLVALNRMNSEMARDFFHALLIGLNVHGQHEVMLLSIMTSLVQTYELLVPNFPCIRDVLLTIPGCTKENLKNFWQQQQ
ncbi:hypothetical protein HELRODRAFT_188729 [Helobdella robusta]|uniref:Uncharacterized protein n=1 Tax=Helobdella robusta TaxID=6412 RepID=T1FQB0_HELRO|nr:hypothetical protein HELRODRAFT_188729 [Helobdella robusta]ESO02508.1 hypothetical protein HELRODRAFT_188729 [Helobdella robusta]